MDTNDYQDLRNLLAEHRAGEERTLRQLRRDIYAAVLIASVIRFDSLVDPHRFELACAFVFPTADKLLAYADENQEGYFK